MTAEVLMAICTYEPKPTDLVRAISSCLNQKGVKAESRRIVVIDNGSEETDVPALVADLDVEVVREPRVGLAYARIAATEAVQNEQLVVFVDDDIELSPNFVASALRLYRENPNLGAFAGPSHLPSGCLARRNRHLARFLAIRDLGLSSAVVPASLEWRHEEPTGAGLVISRPCWDILRAEVANTDHPYFALGRSGSSLISAEDSFIARVISAQGLEWGYFSELLVTHHVDAARFRSRYLRKLLFNFGRSDVLLQQALNRQRTEWSSTSLANVVRFFLWRLGRERSPAILTMRELGQWYQGRRPLYQTQLPRE